MKRNSYHRLSRVLSLGGFCHRIISKDVGYYVISGTSPLGQLQGTQNFVPKKYSHNLCICYLY